MIHSFPLIPPYKEVLWLIIYSQWGDRNAMYLNYLHQDATLRTYCLLKSCGLIIGKITVCNGVPLKSVNNTPRHVEIEIELNIVTK